MENILMLCREFNVGEFVTEYCRRLGRFLVERGKSVDLVCFDDYSRDEQVEGIGVHRVPCILHGDNLFDWGMLINVEFLDKIRRLVNEKEVGLIHANDWITLPSSILAARISGKPLVVSLHSVERERGMNHPHSPVIDSLEMDGAGEADAVVVDSRETLEAIQSFGLPDGKLEVIPPEGMGWLEKIEAMYREVRG